MAVARQFFWVFFSGHFSRKLEEAISGDTFQKHRLMGSQNFLKIAHTNKKLNATNSMSNEIGGSRKHVYVIRGMMSYKNKCYREKIQTGK